MIRTGIFGGSFNPIHKGHTGLAQAILEEGLADEVWLMVTPQNPLKQQHSLLPEQERLQLARLAVKDTPGITACDFEFHLPRPSFTWQTLRALRTAYPNRDFSLIIGADNWHIFPQWAHHEELLSYNIIMYPREGYPVDCHLLPSNVRMVNAPLFPYSSTQIRRAIEQNEDVREMISPDVLQEIRAKGYFAIR